MNRPSTEDQLYCAEPPRAVPDAQLNWDQLVRQECWELHRTNTLARHINALRAQIMDAGRLHSDELQKLQEQHRLHLNRCLCLRSRLALLVQARRHEATQSVFSASN